MTCLIEVEESEEEEEEEEEVTISCGCGREEGDEWDIYKMCSM